MPALAFAFVGLFPTDNGLESPLPSETANCEARLLADASDGRLDHHSVIRAALIAAGERDSQVWYQSEAALAGLARELRESGGLAGSALEQAQAMHRFMHGRMLKGYDPSANNVAELFRSGRFNCITSSTVFIALAAECGWHAAALELPAHVLVVFDPQGAAIAVETTCPDWRMAANVAGGRSGAHGRRIEAAELLATYYHNRGVARLAEGNFAAAIAANRTALRLDAGCAAARQNLLAAWNNWALALADAGNYAAALDKIEAALAVAPGYEPLLENRVYIQTRRKI
jgi:tetratricopeptide (TPR) repeat protein